MLGAASDGLGVRVGPGGRSVVGAGWLDAAGPEAGAEAGPEAADPEAADPEAAWLDAGGLDASAELELTVAALGCPLVHPAARTSAAREAIDAAREGVIRSG